MRIVATLSWLSIGAIIFACSSSSTNGSSDAGAGNTGDGGPGGGLLGEGGGVNNTPPGPVDATPPCDTGLAIDGDATSFAKAIGICTDAASKGFGLVSATYSNSFGVTTPPIAGQWGLLPKFGTGVTAREGTTIGALSSGFAREYDDSTGATGTDFSPGQEMEPGDPINGVGNATGKAPPGFPKAAMGCAQDNLVNDMIDVKLTLKAPMDAAGFQFDFDFYSSEWPNYVCSDFNDAFVAYLTSTTVGGDNISFDSNHNPVAVNNNFLNRCTPSTAVGCLRSQTASPQTPDMPLSTSVCDGGITELAGTGFGDTSMTACMTAQTATRGGATGWLTTQAPVSPGETFTLEFMIWDAGDGELDSVVLLDNFKWLSGGVVTGTGRVH